MSLPVIGASREKDGKGWRITVEAKGPRENSVLGRWGRGEGIGNGANGSNVRGERGKGSARAGRRGRWEAGGIVEEAMKRAGDEKKEGERERERRNDGCEMDEKGEGTEGEAECAYVYVYVREGRTARGKRGEGREARR